jgi:hypothetical protein
MRKIFCLGAALFIAFSTVSAVYAQNTSNPPPGPRQTSAQRLLLARSLHQVWRDNQDWRAFPI